MQDYSRADHMYVCECATYALCVRVYVCAACESMLSARVNNIDSNYCCCAGYN